MLATVFSAAVCGVDAHLVEIEVNAGHGDPETIIVGLPDAAVRESKDRVITAMINSGLISPMGKTTVNLAPADVRKEGPSFDLPIAIGMVIATGGIEQPIPGRSLLVGELALSGEVRRVRGVLPIALAAREEGFARVLVPRDNAREGAVVDGIDVIPIDNLRQAVDFLSGTHPLPPVRADLDAHFSQQGAYDVDYEDVKGQESARRALEVAVAGGHNLLAIGPPGTGKSMLAKRIPTILPPMSLAEALETTKIHSIAGTLQGSESLVAKRPFRTPHHTISDAGLLGGGSNPLPGEISLAHHGVLFLDELPEFHRNVLEVLRQPLEEGEVTIARASATVTFPSRFMLVAAMNPCPCGHYGDTKRECRCNPMQVQRYRNRISGPLLDRIDIHIEVPQVEYHQLSSLAKGEPSSAIRERVVAARGIQLERLSKLNMHCNAEMKARQVQHFCRPTKSAGELLRIAMQDLNFSARAYDRILRVARTIADLAGSAHIEDPHVAEAIQYRSLDRQLWAH